MAITKDEIVLAIKREAAANGGVPLGMRRFQAVTGITQSAWMGRFWSRWNDALADAGFEPNVWNARVDSDEELLEMLVELAKTLGRYPTAADRNLYRRGNPDFPRSETFESRFGKRESQLRLLMDFAIANEEFSEIYDMVAPLLKGKGAAATPEQIALGVTGSVYLMKSGQHHKIGRSNHVGRRSYEVALQLPEKIEVIHEIETDDPEGIELYWHNRFASKRTNGEWFLLTDADVQAFKRRKSFM